MTALSPAGGLSAGESVFAERVDESPGADGRSRIDPVERRSGAAARTRTGRSDSGVGGGERESEAAADGDGGVRGVEGGDTSAVRRRKLEPSTPEVGSVGRRRGRVGWIGTLRGDAMKSGEIPVASVGVPTLDTERGPDESVDGDARTGEKSGEA